MKKASLAVLALIVILGALVFLRQRPDPAGAGGPAATPITASPGPASKSAPPSAASDRRDTGRSRAQLIASTRKRIYEADSHWSLTWAKGGRWSPPLPKQGEFWALVDALKKDLGAETVDVISDLIDDAVAPRTQQLYTALLAALKDPKAEARLASLLTAKDQSLQIYGMALYGLGLLKTESAWQTAREAWDKDYSGGKSILYWGLSLFGDRAFPLLLKEAEADPLAGNAWTALMGMEDPESRSRLWAIVESSKSESMRGGALQALSRSQDPKTLSKLFDLLDAPDRSPEFRRSIQNRLLNLFSNEGCSLAKTPELRDRFLARWDSLTPELQWSLCCDPEVRLARPGALDAIPPPDKMKWTYLYALAAEPARHAQLASYLGAHLNDGSIMWSLGPLTQLGEIKDPALLSVIKSEALRQPEADGGFEGWAWRLMALSPAESRADLYSELSRRFDQFSKDSDRLGAVTNLICAGPDAAPVALNLLERTTNPLIRLDLMGTALFYPGKENELRPLASAEIEQILSGVTTGGMDYIAAHPEGKREGLRRYAEIVRNVFSLYGSPTDIPRIRTYFDGLVLPASLRSGEEALNDEDAREQLQSDILESIDAIRARQ